MSPNSVSKRRLWILAILGLVLAVLFGLVAYGVSMDAGQTRPPVGSAAPARTASASQESYGLPGGATAPEQRARKKDIPRLLVDPAARKLFDATRACFPDDKNDFYDLYEQASCYETLLNAAAAEEHPLVVLHVMQALVADRPDVLSACHNGGHSAVSILTKRLWNPTASYDVQLAQMRDLLGSATDVCQNGYVHGFYDAIGKGGPNMDSFKAIGVLCKDLGGIEGRIDCGHGLGHSVWYATQDFNKAVEICGLFESDLKYRCDDGIIMYVPDEWTKTYAASTGKSGWAADPRSELWDIDRYYQDSLDLCRKWPASRAGDPNPRFGCWMGIVSGLLWRPMTTLLNYGDYEDIAVEVKPLVTKAEWVCISLGGEAEEVCMEEWDDLIPFVAQNIPKNVEDICSALVKYEQRCLKESLARLKLNVIKDTELSRYERE
jgi:hypothetical protein